MGLLETVQTALTTAGVVTADWPCYIGFTPDVGPVITLYLTGGFPQDTHQGETRRPTFQVAVRGDELGYAAAEAKIRAAYAAIENANLTDVYLLHAMSEPLQWNDAKNRTVFSQNYRAVVAT